MSASDTKEMVEEFDLEYWFDRESRPYKVTHGSSGDQINAQECPHCGDKRWRTYLNKDTGSGNCFVCNETFSKLGFVHSCLGGDPGSKADWRDTFTHVKECLSEQGWRPVKKASVAVDFVEVKLPASFALPTADGQNLQYLEDRGIDVDLAEYFHLRYCVKGVWRFTRGDGTEGWQNFDGRVIIPVFDLNGECVTYQGRDVTGLAGDKKYLFPSGLPGTGRFLYNGQSVLRSKAACMGEGAFDVFSIKRAFDEDPALRHVGSLGSFGKHLSYGSTDGNDQLGRFRELRLAGLEEVTIMWDGEWKALIAALDAAELLRQVGLRVRIAMLPAGRDPNEVLPEVVRQAYRDAVPYDRLLSVKWRLRNPFTLPKR